MRTSFLTAPLILFALLTAGCGERQPPTLDKDGGYVLTFAVEKMVSGDVSAAEIEARVVARLQGYSNVRNPDAKLIDGELHVALPGVVQQQVDHCRATLENPAQLGLQLAADPELDARFYEIETAADERRITTSSGRSAIWRRASQPEDHFEQVPARQFDGVEHYLLLESPDDIDGGDFTNFRKTYDPNSEGLAIEFALTPEGAKRIQRITETYRGRLLAIVFNHQIVSMPQIRGTIGERGVITGRFAEADVEKMVTIGAFGKYGELPRLRFISQKQVKSK